MKTVFNFNIFYNSSLLIFFSDPKVKQETTSSTSSAEKTVNMSSVSDNSFCFKDISLTELKSNQISMIEQSYNLSSEFLTVDELNKYNSSFCKYYLYLVYLIYFTIHLY